MSFFSGNGFACAASELNGEHHRRSGGGLRRFLVCFFGQYPLLWLRPVQWTDGEEGRRIFSCKTESCVQDRVHFVQSENWAVCASLYASCACATETPEASLAVTPDERLAVVVARLPRVGNCCPVVRVFSPRFMFQKQTAKTAWLGLRQSTAANP